MKASQFVGTRLALAARVAEKSTYPNHLDLNAASVALAKRISPIEYDPGDTSCEPFDILKHITSEALRKKLGI